MLNGGSDDDILFGGIGSDVLQGNKGIDSCEFGLDNTVNCELVAPLIADLTLFLGTDVEYISPGDLLELELEVYPRFTTTLIENIQVSIIYDNLFKFNLDETLNEIDSNVEDVSFLVSDLGDGTFQLIIDAVDPNLITSFEEIIIFDVPLSTPASSSTMFVETTTIHPNFSDSNIDDNSGTMDVIIFVP